MINISEVIETNKMIEQENLDVRTITMGISLLSCADSSLEKTCENIYKKITSFAKNLVETGNEISREFSTSVFPLLQSLLLVPTVAILQKTM